MKIISANRSDTFDEYLRIISRYNENNLVKEGTWHSTGRDLFQGSERLVGKSSGDIASELAAASAKTIDPARFSKAGVANANELKRIFSLAEDLLTGDKFLVEEGGRLRRATPDELSVINEWATRNPGKMAAGNNMSFNAGIGPTNPAFRKVKNVTEKNSVDLAKELQTGSKFTPDEAREFRQITADLIGEPVPTRAATEAETDAARAATEAEPPPPGKTSRRPSRRKESPKSSPVQTADASGSGATAINAGGDVTIINPGGAGNSVLDTSKLATREQVTSMRTFFRKSFESLSATVADLPTKIDELLKTRNAELLAEIGTKIDDSIKASLGEVTTKVDELSKTVQTMDGNISAINSTVKNLEGQVAAGNTAVKEVLESQRKTAEEMVAMRKQMADSLEEMKKMKKEFEEALKNSKVAIDPATPAVAKVTWWTKTKNFLVSAAAIAAAIAGSYWLYNKLTGEEEGSEGSGDGPSNTSGDTGVPEDRNDGFQNQMEDPARRESMIDNAEKLGGAEGDALLNKMAAYYRASGYVKLDEPISINGTTIRYAFPTKVSGGVDPVTDIGRREATKSYLAKAYNEDPEKYRDMTTRFATGARSSDPQRIANYAFSITAGAALFSSKGTFLGMGERGKRYGRGKENVGRGDFGFAGTSQKKMTREERRAIENMNRMSDADDFMENDIDDPMQAFASGQNEFFQKKAEDINNSTNKYQSYEFAKKADKISNRYFKDAVQDLQDDEFMKAYYSGFSKLHNEKPKKTKPDYEKLYDLHDETGADLVHEAHPKAITVAEAIGKGGLVENGSERSKAMEDIAFRVPSGNYRARYAFIQEALKKKS